MTIKMIICICECAAGIVVKPRARIFVLTVVTAVSAAIS
jgi:hypothetical protein